MHLKTSYSSTELVKDDVLVGRAIKHLNKVKRATGDYLVDKMYYLLVI